ncbi:MAG: VCBS repeat-containing protein, partial [Candidatus Heimdallarchaeota archaeon]|nr:VCBS repeat-containing protein [Candidatus Heimdallarchaeota archaeon]
MKENKLIKIGIFLLFLSCSFVGLNDFSYHTNGKDQSNIFLIKEIESEPLLLDSNVYDQYANGTIVNRGSSTNPLPRAFSTSSHPITKDEFQLINLDEFAILPIPVEPACHPRLYQDAGESFDGYHWLPDVTSLYTDYYRGYQADIATGDVDGDGYDETIIADSGGAGWGSIKVYDDVNNNYAKIIDFVVENPTGYYKSITTGDVDGDGCDEIIYTRFIPGYTIPEGISCSVALWVYEVVPTWMCLTPYEFRVKNGYYDAHDIIEFYSNNGLMMEPEVACGDFDGDGVDEIAVAFSFRNDDPNYEDFWILDDYVHGFQTIWWGNVIEGVTGDIDLAAGDFDGDGVDEIAYAACPWNGEQLEGQLAIINNIGIMNYEIIRLPIVEAPGGVWVHRFPVACGDIDGDGRDEIGVVRAYREAYPGDLFLYEYSPATGNYVLLGVIEKDFMDFGLSMGDVDCDGLAEIVCAGRFYMGVLDDAQHGFNVLMQNLAYGGLVACGEFDGDGMRLKYTGESWINTAPPGVITVIAAPPLYRGIDQNYLSSYT